MSDKGRAPIVAEEREARRRLRSLLSPSLKRLLGVAMVLAAAMMIDTVYLLTIRLLGLLGIGAVASQEIFIPLLYQVALLSHTLVGFILAALLALFLATHLPTVWTRRHRASILTGVAFAIVGVILVVTGLFIFTDAASRENQWAWWTHVGAAVLVVAGYVGHRVVSHARPPRARYRRFGLATVAGAALLLLAHGLPRLWSSGSVGVDLAVTSTERDEASGAFVPIGYVAPASPFFPSPATTRSGGQFALEYLVPGVDQAYRDLVSTEVREEGFVSSSLIGADGCVRCHQDVTEQWSASAHRFASFNNPFYEATIRDLRTGSLETNPWIEAHLDTYQVVAGPGEAKSKWCAGCHDQALLFTGAMGGAVESTSVEAQAGITCLACHSIESIHDQSGNGNYRLDDLGSDGYLFRGAGEGTLGRFLHDGVLRARPAPHKQRMQKPFFKSSEYCATCHKVSLTEPLNNYRWLRGQDEFDAWHDSGISLNAARTFYLPDAVRVCQDCHMPPEPAPLGDMAADSGTVRSHRFVAVNTALPFLRDDTETIARIERFLQDEKLRVDIFALTREGAAIPEMDLRETGPALQPGERILLDVVVRNLGVGHTFPGGTNDSNQGWLEVTVAAPDGTTLAVSGALDEDGRLDPSAHVFSALILDREGRPIDRRNAQDIHVTVFANVVGPGSADIARYELTVPPELAGSSLSITARLLWRKFNQGYTVFAFQANPGGFGRFQDVPELPVTEIERDFVTFAVTDEVEGGVSSSPDPARWILFNDYGIALLGDGNTRLARLAFARVEELQPSRWDGPLNLARAALLDGDLEGAYQALARVEALESGNPRAAWVWGQVLQEDGRYEEAVQAYERVLASFPGDRATWRALGRTLYLDQQFEAALTAFAEVLDIDPEDRVSHYHRMLSLRALGREGEAAVAEEAYLYYAIDESAQEITRAYRLRDEGANLMAQPIPTHPLRPPT